MKKKRICFLSALLAICLLLGMAGCKPENSASQGNGETKPSGTSSGTAERKEPITLTYASWEEEELNQFLIQKFESKYEHITVNLVSLDQNSWEQGLFNLATTGDLPDAYWTFDLASAAVNGWTRDITSIYDNDAYTKKINDDMKSAGLYDGVRYGVATRQFPFVVFLNKTLFEQANVPLPSYNWTMDDMYKAAKALTVPRQNIYGLSDPIDYFRVFYPVANSENLLNFGFDPKTQTFDMKLYAEGQALAKKYNSEGITAHLTAEQKEAAYGKSDIWMPETGKLGMQLDWFWTSNYMKSDVFTNQGMEWLIYPLPAGTTNRLLTTVDFAAVSATTEHPEEAYELLKFMTFGGDGWKAKLEWYSFKHKIPTQLPIANDDEVWNLIKELTPGEDYAALYKALENAAPDIQKCIPGYGAWWNWTFEQDIWGRLERDEAKMEDLAPQMAARFKQFYDEAMARIKSKS